jgi:acetoin utilization deacetylase AcuC-like enzyme
MDPDQPAHPSSLIRIHAVLLQILLQVEKLIANSMDPNQTGRMHRLVWIHAGRKRTMLVLSWRGSIHVIGYDCAVHHGVYDYTCIVSGASIQAAQSLNNHAANIAINWYGGWHHGKK